MASTPNITPFTGDIDQPIPEIPFLSAWSITVDYDMSDDWGRHGLEPMLIKKFYLSINEDEVIIIAKHYDCRPTPQSIMFHLSGLKITNPNFHNAKFIINEYEHFEVSSRGYGFNIKVALTPLTSP